MLSVEEFLRFVRTDPDVAERQTYGSAERDGKFLILARQVEL